MPFLADLCTSHNLCVYSTMDVMCKSMFVFRKKNQTLMKTNSLCNPDSQNATVAVSTKMYIHYNFKEARKEGLALKTTLARILEKAFTFS